MIVASEHQRVGRKQEKKHRVVSCWLSDGCQQAPSRHHDVTGRCDNNNTALLHSCSVTVVLGYQCSSPLLLILASSAATATARTPNGHACAALVALR